MATPNYLRLWLSGKKQGIYIVFFIILLSAVVQFATFALSQNYVVSYFGAQPEDVAMALQLSYIGILASLPLQFRMIRYFEMRNYLIVNITFGIFLNILCIHTNDIIFFFILRFFQGVVVCSIAGCMLIGMTSFLKMEHKAVVGPTVFFGTILSSGVLIGLVFANVSLNSDWKEIYYYLIAFQIFSLFLVTVAFNGRTGMKKYPLFQIDWTGSVFFLCSAICLAYTFIYGSKYYWFSDLRILFSATVSLVCAALYLFHSSGLRRPLITVSAFKYPKFWAGLGMLAMYYGIKESLNLIFGYATNVLQWSASQVMMLGLFNLAGLFVFMFISAKLLIEKKVPIPVFLITGFSVLLFYHFWMYNIITPDLSFGDLIFPMFLQGAASGLLFVPITIFTLTSLPPSTGNTGMIVAAYARFISLLNVSAGFYNLQLYFNQLFRESLLSHITAIDNPVSERLGFYRQLFMFKGIPHEQAEALANVNLSKALALQAQMLSNRAIFLTLGYLALIILTLIIVLMLSKTFRNLLRPIPN